MRVPLPAERLPALLEPWGLGPLAVEWIPPGATADVFLVEGDHGRFVAKLAYEERSYFEAGLLASERVAAAVDLPVATPRPTADGDLVVMVEWPEGHEHPLALLELVEGEPLDPDALDTPATVGRVCGLVHRALLDVDPADVGIRGAEVGPMFQPDDGWDLGEHGWLDRVCAELVELAAGEAHRLRWTVGVWDGPDVRRDADGRLGLLDFGHTFWQPLVHAVANRWLVSAYADADRRHRFRAALDEHLTLTDAEEELLPVHALLSATYYARWAATQIDGDTRVWLEVLVDHLRAELPAIGITPG